MYKADNDHSDRMRAVQRARLERMAALRTQVAAWWSAHKEIMLAKLRAAHELERDRQWSVLSFRVSVLLVAIAVATGLATISEVFETGLPLEGAFAAVT